MIWCERDRNAEALRTQSSCPRISSALSASPRFKSSFSPSEEVEDDGVPFAEKMDGLTRELATQFHESEKLQAAIRDNVQLRLVFFPTRPYLSETRKHYCARANRLSIAA